ncbi:unnamed protein product [Lymnaea stagnalis]|uniref:type I protein arginine methyltransferase n=1 Tax=Lymnaea stagnalis TaxID=6523 RepID=A0AAV2IIW8_LYMST
MASCNSIDKDSDVPALVSDSESELEKNNEEEDECQWNDLGDEEDEEEMNMLHGNVSCLFCQCVETSVYMLLTHCTQIHNFDLLEQCKKGSVDCIGYIKMINFIRKEHPIPEDLKKYLSSKRPLWLSDDYMIPTDSNDLMLQLDIEWAQNHHQSVLEPTNHHEDCSQHACGDTYSESEAVSALIERVQKAETQRDIYKDELDRALADIEKLRITGQNLVASSKGEDENVQINGSQLNDEDGYFASYSHHDIHMSMLKDKVRTESYRDFMLTNPSLFKDKLILDVGCGTGILSMFAVKAGAKHVVAVDQSNIIYQAMDIARENNLHEKITFVKGRLEEVNLPIEKFDVIISEWMGYFLLFEAMLDSVLWARDRYLKPEGCVYPDQFSMLVIGVTDTQMRNSKLDFWDDVYGFKMSCMKHSVVDEVHVRLVNKETIVTEPAVIKTIDVMNCKVSDLDFTSTFTLKCQSDAEITALVGYFDTYFDKGCQNKVSFSTGPMVAPTHWEQAVMMLPKTVTATKDSSIDCKISYRKHPQDVRGIIINLTIAGQKLKYSLS